MAPVVVIYDRSLSMPMNNLFLRAQSKATETIEGLGRSGGPDHLCAAVAFGARAALVEPTRLAELEWDYEYGSNLAEALQLALASLNGQRGRIVLCSDCFASAHTDESGEVVFSCPPAKETVERTVEAVRSCGHAGVTIEAFRYRNGEVPEDEAWPVVAVLDAILEAGGLVEDIDVDDPVPTTNPNRSWRYSA
jgi:uncharacterized protein with von Willebrand factor type A (vWA) domain